MDVPIPLDQHQIAAFCHRWDIIEFSLFGSVLRDDFRPHSDVDILVTFALDAHRTLFDMVHMQEQLQKMFKRKVDLVSRRGIEASRNAIRRHAILSSAEVVYAS